MSFESLLSGKFFNGGFKSCNLNFQIARLWLVVGASDDALLHTLPTMRHALLTDIMLAVVVDTPDFATATSTPGQHARNSRGQEELYIRDRHEYLDA